MGARRATELKSSDCRRGNQKQPDRLFSIMGAEMIDGAGRISAPAYNDTLRLALFKIDTDHPPNCRSSTICANSCGALSAGRQ